MPTPAHVLLVTANKGTVEIQLDRPGLSLLMDRLEWLRSQLDVGQCEHFHFWADSWGGSDLSESVTGGANAAR